MKVFLGESGLRQSWQDKFPKQCKCHKCEENARIMFVAFEESEKEYVYKLHKNIKGKYWPHDAIACAVYLCEKCFEVTAILNQA